MSKHGKFNLAWAAIGEFLSRYKAQVISLTFLGVFLAIFDAAIPFIVGGFLDAVIDASKTLTLFGIEAPLWLWFIGAFAVVQFAASILGWAHESRSRRVGTLLSADYMYRATSRLMLMPMSFHKEEKPGIIWDRVTRADSAVVTIIERVVLRISPQLLSVVAGVFIAVNINVTLTLIVLGGISLYVAALLKIVPPLVKIQKKAHGAWNRAFQQAYRVLASAHTVKQFTAEDYEDKRVHQKYFREAVPKWNEVEQIWSNIAFYQRVVVVITQLSVFLVSVYFINQGDLTVGGLVAFNGYTAMVFGPFTMLGYNWETIQNGLVALEQSEKILGTPAERYEPEELIDPGEIKGGIAFEGVNFRYSVKEPVVLKNVSFAIEPGEVVALVGESGVGKTTIAELISGYYIPTKGAVLLDGVDIRNLRLSKLREAIAVVPQEVMLFNDTIEHNIKYGDFRASKAQVQKAAREACAEEFIQKFRNKYGQLVGERGVKLSVGQKQRVAIARAILRDPKILILDEPTSALDVQTERQITESLEKLMRGRTTIIIAHRLSTVRKADRILVFDKGNLIEQGSHWELIAREGGLYQKLYKLHIGLS
ncbi:MAG: ABC transporter ATP-binding protein [bacterium]|nr:ABC transporter ATP-binding protein [bacterium]